MPRCVRGGGGRRAPARARVSWRKPPAERAATATAQVAAALSEESRESRSASELIAELQRLQAEAAVARQRIYEMARSLTPHGGARGAGRAERAQAAGWDDGGE